MSKAYHRQRQGTPYLYRVQYWGLDQIHNTYFFDEYDWARQRYLHLTLDQLLEDKVIKKVKFEMYSRGEYITIFEQVANP